MALQMAFVAPVSFMTALETASAAPAMAKPAAKPPVVTVTTTATTTATMAESQPKAFWALAAFSCFWASLMEFSIFSICVSWADCNWPLSDSSRSPWTLAISSSIFICR